MQNSTPIESFLSSLDLNWHDLIESLPVGILFFNDKWEIKSYNNNFIEFFTDEILGNEIEDLNLFSNNPLSSKLPLKDILSLKLGRYFEKEIALQIRGNRKNLVFKGSPIFIDDIFQGGSLIVEDYNFYKIGKKTDAHPLRSMTKILNMLSCYYLIIDEDGTVSELSENLQTKYEYFNNSAGNKISDLFETEYLLDLDEIIKDIRETNGARSIDLIITTESERFDFNSVFMPLREENYLILLLREKMSSENDIIGYLSDSKEIMEIEKFARTAYDALFKIDFQGRINLWVDNAAKLFDIDSASAKSKFIGTIFPVITHNYFENIINIVLNKGEWKGYLESGYLEKDEILEVKIISRSADKMTEFLVFCNKIEKKAYNLMVSENEEKLFFKDAVVKSNEMVIQVNPIGTILFANERFCEVLSKDLDELQGKQLFNLIDPAFKKEHNIFDFESLINIKEIDFWHIIKDHNEIIEVCVDINLSTDKKGLKYFTIYLRECSKQDMLFLKTAHSLLYQFPAPIAIVHKKVIIKVNPEFCALFGSEYETNFYNKSIDAIIDKSSRDDLHEFLSDFERNDFESEITLIKQDSSTFKAKISKIYSSSEFSFSVIRFDHLMESMKPVMDPSEIIKSHFHHIGPYFWTGKLTDGKIELDFIDQDFITKIGYIDENIKFTPGFWESIIHPDDIERFYFEIADLKNSKEDKTKEINYRIINKNSDVVWISNTVKIELDNDAKTDIIFGSITDATDWLSEREELKSIIDELDRLNTAKEKFISIISHDLKSPFTSIVGFAELILTDSTLTNEDILGFVSHIKEASLHTVDLLNSLLDLTKLQTGRIEVEPKVVNANYLVNKTVEILSGLAYQKEIRLTSDIDKSIYITADDNLILQVFNNLVANSIKFTPKGGSVEIFAREIPEKQKIEFTVKDTGVGIDQEDIEKLFVVDKKFTTLGTDGERGTGLGLSLVNEIIEKHNGNIKVKSEVGKGSEFIFSLPISTPSILILDGIKSDRVLYSKLLQTITESIEIIAAENEEQALEIIQNKMPMLVIFEHDLPNMKGDEFIGELVKAELIYQPSLFVLTRNYSNELNDSYKDIGVNEVFSKPFELQKFKSKLDKYIGKVE